MSELSALMVVGPRAIGKTTTFRRRAATTVELDVEAQGAAFRADPDAALRDLEEPVLLDEWQTVPGVLGAVARSVNDDPRPNRFLVAGSALPGKEDGPWPATGRLERIPMWPMTIAEQRRLAPKPFFDRVLAGTLTAPAERVDLRDYVALALTGGFPRPALQLRSARARTSWFDSYLYNLLHHDAAQVEPTRTRPRDADSLRHYFEAYALNSAGVCPHKTIYDAAQIRRETAEGYESILSRLYVVEQVPGWTSNRLSRLVEMPKRYVVDPALLAYLLRVDVPGVMRDGDLLGRILDTFVVAQLRPEIAISSQRPRLYHLRTPGGRQEIDLLVEFGGDRVVAIEMKAAAAVGTREARHLRWLRDELGARFLAGVVLHTGPAVFEVDDRIVAAPISTLWNG
ncbi:MAG TPA: DUF4143 domain-containing protein [Gaiellaceae bacterium]|nr:DUF4143 domain-containing protein [Gaiellaceae bacterium]